MHFPKGSNVLHAEYEKHEKERIRREHKRDLVERLIRTLESGGDLPMGFDDNTFLTLTDRITVYADERSEFTFLNRTIFTSQL